MVNFFTWLQLIPSVTGDLGDLKDLQQTFKFINIFQIGQFASPLKNLKNIRRGLSDLQLTPQPLYMLCVQEVVIRFI